MLMSRFFYKLKRTPIVAYRVSLSTLDKGGGGGVPRVAVPEWLDKQTYSECYCICRCYNSEVLVFPCILLCSSLYIGTVAPKRKCNTQTNWHLLFQLLLWSSRQRSPTRGSTPYSIQRGHVGREQTHSRGTNGELEFMENWNLLGLDKQAGLRSGQLKCVKGPCNIY